MQVMSAAYESGLADGVDWDLDGFDSVHEALAVDPATWSEATIRAMGYRACAQAWGIAAEEEVQTGAACRQSSAWELAMREYDRGVRAALIERNAGVSP